MEDGVGREGWFTDPYARQEERWMSQGKPTKLAGDAWGEGDSPPSGWFRHFATGDSYLDPPPGRGVPKAYESPRHPEPEVDLRRRRPCPPTDGRDGPTPAR
jgi:hypothetical protein